MTPHVTLSPDKAVTESILLSIEEGVTIYDKDFCLVAWNDKYAEMGITPTEHIKKGLHIEDTYRHAATLGLFGPGDAKQIAEHRLAQVYAGTSPAVEDLRGTDGTVIEIRRYFLPRIGVAAVFSDVTANRRSLARVRRSEEVELLARITGGLCHDFNNVLQGVVANLELASVGSNSPHIAAALKAAMNAALSGADLAKSMLDLIHPGTASTEASFDAVVTAERTISWLKRVLRDNVVVDFTTTLPFAEVELIQGQFSAALGNLILNSDDALERGGTIQVVAQSKGDMLSVQVIDNGRGVSQESLQDVVQPYISAKGRKGEGLIEVKKFAQAAGGSFSIESSRESGTVATILLPARFEAQKNPDVRIDEPFPNVLARVLLVEDRPDVKSPVQLLLERHGCTTVSAVSAESAMEIIDATHDTFFDVVVADVNLSGSMNGIELANSLLANKPSLPTILLTANSTENTDPNITMLHKPITFEVLLRQISGLLDDARLGCRPTPKQ